MTGLNFTNHDALDGLLVSTCFPYKQIYEHVKFYYCHQETMIFIAPDTLGVAQLALYIYELFSYNVLINS